MASGNAAHVSEELGDVLFSAVNLSRFLGVEAEDALSATVTKLTRRFQEMERA